MADVAKSTAVKVVSNNSSATNGVSELTACNNDPELTLNLPSPDEEEGTSLQELIESELAALRRKEELLIDSELSTISNTFSETVVVDDDDIDTDTEKATMGDITSPPTRDNNDLSINTQFLLAERDHSFQISKGDAMFFFNTVVDDEPPMNGIATNPFVEDDQEMSSSQVPEAPEEALLIDTGTVEGPQDIADDFRQSSTVQNAEENLQESPDLSDTCPAVKDPSEIDILPLSTSFDPFTTIVDNSNSKSEPAETPSSECADTDFNSLLPIDSGIEKLEDGVDEVEGTVEGRGVLVENVETLLDYADVSPCNVDVVLNDASNSMEDVECAGMSDNSSVGSKRVPVVTNVFDTLEVDDEDLPGLTSPIEPVAPQRTLTIPEIGIIPPQDDDNTDEISESELVSNEELSIGSNGVPAQPVVDLDSPAEQADMDLEPPADQADVDLEPPADQQAGAAGMSVEETLVDFVQQEMSSPLITDLDSPVEQQRVVASDDGFDTWTTVGEAVIEETATVEPVHEDLPVVCDTNKDESLSDSEQNESLSSVSSIDKKLKKKKKSDGGESTKTKKTKKTKKSDEKENISVIANSSDSARTEIETNKENCTNREARIEDDLSNVSVTVLKSTYSNQIRSQGPKDVVKEIDEDILHCGPIQSLKQTYCSEATKGFHKRDAPEPKKELIATGISIKELRRSFGDLRNVGREDADEGAEPEEQYDECMKSSFSKFDQLSKKTVLHVRSVDASKVQKQFNQSAPEQQLTSNCKSCGKQVFQMEQIKAERAVWHKNCFRCKECNKQLTVDIYSSHEGQLYCKPHFRELFKPKAVLDDESNEPPRLRKPELIIRENQPIELPPEVVRASDKPDLGLEELSALNVKSRYQVFEKAQESSGAEVERSPSSVSVKRSPSILSKLARFQAKGMDIGVTDDSLNGIPIEESSSSSEEENEDDLGENGETDKELIRSNRKQREQPISFTKMEDVKSRWETGQAAWREEQRQERKQEIQNLRSKLFMGKQGKMKELYEQAVKESEGCTQKKEVGIRCEKAKTIKEKFERGEVLPDDDEAGVPREQEKKGVDEDMSVFEAGISKKSRSLFLELDATAAKQPPTQIMSPVKSPVPKDDSRRRSREVILASRQTSEDVVRSSDQVEEVKVETAEISNKFKFFETYKTPEKQRRQFRITPPREGQVKAESPEREIYRDPEVVRCEDKVEEEEVMRTNTAKKMLSLFRQMEENATKEELPEGPKPLKRFTPPPDYTQDSETDEEETESEEEDEEEEEDEADPNIVRASDKIEDEFLKQAQTAARAKALRAKFERWEEKENKANANAATNASHAVGNLNGALDQEQAQEFQPSIDTTRSLRARFESLKNETQQPKERTPRPKVNRFVEIQTNCAEFCSTCEKKVYPLEKIETGGKIFHKQCFRCLQCNCILRMETYTLNNGKPYCIPHFKQLFIAKGNYEEGFGMDQHKRKWNSRNNSSDDNDILSALNSSTED